MKQLSLQHGLAVLEICYVNRSDSVSVLVTQYQDSRQFVGDAAGSMPVLYVRMRGRTR